jgi:siroheme synthase-like protein
MSLLPIFLKLSGRRTLVVGAGEVALSKIESLLEAHADVRVVALDALPLVHQLAAQGRIHLELREFSTTDLENTFIVIAATDDIDANAYVFREANARDILCNAVDDPPNCDFYFGSVVKRGDLQIAISTAGESPAVAQRLRKEIDAQLPEDLGPWLSQVGALRREVLAAHPAGEPRKLLLHALAQRQICSSNDCPSRKMALHTPASVSPNKYGQPSEAESEIHPVFLKQKAHNGQNHAGNGSSNQ